MDIIKTAILGIIQGLTEFLPISSSGHLVLGQYALGIDHPGILLEVVLHLGTLLAILMYYNNDLMMLIAGILKGEEQHLSMALNLVVATFPAFLAGFFFKDQLAALFLPSTVPFALVFTGCILFFTRDYFNNKNEVLLSVAIFIGFAQILAMLPGVSRSGMTIATALFLGVQREQAARFSFFMAIPVLLGAGIFQMLEVDALNSAVIPALSVGFVASAVSGYLVIRLLMKLISNHLFWIFSYYCWLVGFISYYIIIYNHG